MNQQICQENVFASIPAFLRAPFVPCQTATILIKIYGLVRFVVSFWLLYTLWRKRRELLYYLFSRTCQNVKKAKNVYVTLQ